MSRSAALCHASSNFYIVSLKAWGFSATRDRAQFTDPVNWQLIRSKSRILGPAMSINVVNTIHTDVSVLP